MTVPDAAPGRDADRRAALALVPVSRETEGLLALYVDRLLDWQRIKNLVAPSTLDHVWTRHIADSAQLPALAPEALRWADLGSGAGFPGLVVAIMLRDRPGAMVHLVEANGRKCAFLREVARATRAPATIHAGRIDEVLPRLGRLDVVTSRALTGLPALVGLARSLLDCGTTGLFLTGEDARGANGDSEAALAPFRLEAIPSLTQSGARIMRVSRPPGA